MYRISGEIWSGIWYPVGSGIGTKQYPVLSGICRIYYQLQLNTFATDFYSIQYILFDNC